MNDDEIAEAPALNNSEFELAEDTDLNEDELDLNVSRKMSIRALNVATMHRFSPGSINPGQQRISNVGLTGRSGLPPPSAKPNQQHRPSLLLRASSLIRKSNMNRVSRLTQSRVSNLRNMKQSSVISGRDSTFDISVDEEEGTIPGIIGMSVHRCSMIKKYNIETFFTPAKMHRRAITTETQPLMPVSGRARLEPVDSTHPTN